MILSIKPKKNTPRKKLADWIKSCEPSETKPYLYHDPKVTFLSKKTIVWQEIRYKLFWKGIQCKYIIQPVPDEIISQHGLKFSKGYEPVLIWITSKTKKTKKHDNHSINKLVQD